MCFAVKAKQWFFVLVLMFQATGAVSVDIVRLYREALVNDAQYAAARATVEAGRQREPQALAGLLPHVGILANTAWNEYRYGLNNNPHTRRHYTADGYNVRLTQPIFNWHNIVQYGQGRWQVIQAEAIFAQATQDLILRVSQAYFDVLYAEENLKAVRTTRQAIFQQLEQARKNFEVGTATITDSQEAQSRFDLASALEISAINDLEVKRHALRVIVGRDFGRLSQLKPAAVLAPPEPAIMDKWVEAAVRDNIAVLAQQAATEVANKEVKRMRAGHYPTLDAVAHYGRTSTATFAGTDMLTTTGGSIGMQLNIPIFQGGYVTARAREAVANRVAAMATLESARRVAELDARQSFLGTVNGLARVRALEAALISSMSALESNRLGYEVGIRIKIDVLNAEQQVYTTRRDLSRARFDVLLSQLKLQASVGSLGEDDLLQISPLFEMP